MNKLLTKRTMYITIALLIHKTNNFSKIMVNKFHKFIKQKQKQQAETSKLPRLTFPLYKTLMTFREFFIHKLYKVNIMKYILIKAFKNPSTSIDLVLKSTLIEIWESSYMFVFIKKTIHRRFCILIPRVLEIFACEVCKFLKTQGNF